MQYKEFQPTEPLQKYINCFWLIETGEKENLAGQWDRTLPDGSLEIVFHLEDQMVRKTLDDKSDKESENILIGQVTKPYLFKSTGKMRMLGIRFFPHSAHHFFDISVNEVNDRALNLEFLWGRPLKFLREKVIETGDVRQAIGILELFLIAKIKDKSPSLRDRYFTYACHSILSKKGTIPIGDISADIGISNRCLEMVFNRKMGISPKFFARIIRFQHTLQYLALPQSATLTKVAHRAGYFDQSHFVRDFKQFTGLTPKAFIQEPHPITGHFINPEYCSYLYNL